MTVKLSLLDRLGSVTYERHVEVILEHDINHPIGTCEVYTDEKGNHFGLLTLNRRVDQNLYFYYRNQCSDDGLFWFSGLQLLTKPLHSKPTTQLKDMLIH